MDPEPTALIDMVLGSWTCFIWEGTQRLMGLHRRSRPPSMDGLSVPTGFARIWRAAGEKMVGSIHLPPPPKDARIQSLSAPCQEDIKGLKPLDWGNLQPSSRATLNCAPFLPLGQDCAPAPKIPPRWASWVHSSVKNSSPEPTVETCVHCVSSSLPWHRSCLSWLPVLLLSLLLCSVHASNVSFPSETSSVFLEFHSPLLGGLWHCRRSGDTPAAPAQNCCWSAAPTPS